MEEKIDYLFFFLKMTGEGQDDHNLDDNVCVSKQYRILFLIFVFVFFHFSRVILS